MRCLSFLHVHTGLNKNKSMGALTLNIFTMSYFYISYHINSHNKIIYINMESNKLDQSTYLNLQKKSKLKSGIL